MDNRIIGGVGIGIIITLVGIIVLLAVNPQGPVVLPGNLTPNDGNGSQVANEQGQPSNGGTDKVIVERTEVVKEVTPEPVKEEVVPPTTTKKPDLRPTDPHFSGTLQNP